MGFSGLNKERKLNFKKKKNVWTCVVGPKSSVTSLGSAPVGLVVSEQTGIRPGCLQQASFLDNLSNLIYKIVL